MINRWRLFSGAACNVVLAFVAGHQHGYSSSYVTANYTIAVILFWIGVSVKETKQ